MRQLRAVVATLVTVALGSSAHTMGGGSPLQPLSAAVLIVLVWPPVWFLLRARTSVVRLVLATAAGQVVTHLALVGMAPSPAGGAVAHHAHGGSVAAVAGSAQPMSLHATGTMVLAHALATVLASWLLAVGEDVVCAVARLVVRALRPTTPASPPRIGAGDAPVRRLSGRSPRPLGGRAPPLFAC